MTPAELDAITAGRTARRREAERSHYERNKENIIAKRKERRRALSATERNEYNERAAEKLRGARATNRALVNKLKNEPCADCGGLFPPVCMDFDHRTGETKTSGVSELAKAGRSSDVILAEIAKCDLVCSNCHRVRTYKRHHGIST